MGKIIMILFLATAGVSYLYSGAIYRFYLKTYYRYVKKSDYDAMMSHARELYRAEKFRELREYLKVMTVLYHDRLDVRRLQGMVMIKSGEERRGLDMIVTTINIEKVDPDYLPSLADLMYQYRLYPDMISLIEKNGHRDDYMLLFYYGVSLVKTGKPVQAREYLLKAKKLGEYSLAPERQFELYFYLGIAGEETGDLNESLKYYTAAKGLAQRDPEVKKALVRVYRKKGMLREAEDLIGR